MQFRIETPSIDSVAGGEAFAGMCTLVADDAVTVAALTQGLGTLADYLAGAPRSYIPAESYSIADGVKRGGGVPAVEIRPGEAPSEAARATQALAQRLEKLPAESGLTSNELPPLG